MSAKAGEFNKSLAEIFKAVSAFAKAVLVGANTVNLDKGLVRAGNNSAFTTALVKIEKLVWSPKAMSTTVVLGNKTASKT